MSAWLCSPLANFKPEYCVWERVPRVLVRCPEIPKLWELDPGESKGSGGWIHQRQRVIRETHDGDLPQAAIYRCRIGCPRWYLCDCKGPGSILTPGGLVPGSGSAHRLLIMVWRGLSARTAGRPWLGPTLAQESWSELGILCWNPSELQLGPVDPDLDFDPQLMSQPALLPG